MTLEEQDYFRQKMQDEYGPGWESIVRDYGGMVNPKVGPAGKMTEPGMSFDPTRFRADNPLSLLSSKEDIDAVLRDPSLRTKQDYINELDRMDPDRLQGPVRPPMEMNTSGVPYWDDPETAGTKIPFPEQNPAGNPSWEQTNALYDQGQSNYYGPTGSQNRISPLPHQLEGPERGKERYGEMQYDPNQELYDPNYYGTAGQMGQMGPPLSPGEGMGMGIMSDAHPFSQGMPHGEMPGLLNSGGEYVSQALPRGQSTTEQDWQKQAWDKKSGSPGSKKGSGWMADDRMRNAQNRDFRLGQMLMNLGEKSREDDGWGSPLTHY